MKFREFTIAAVVFAVVLVLVISFISPPASGQANPVTNTVSLNYLTIQVAYPPEVLPGDIVTAHVQANAKSSFYLVSLMVQVFYADGNNIRQLATKTLASNSYMSTGNSISSDIQITIPQNAPRTSLVAAFSEGTRVASYDYSYYSYYNYNYPYNNSYMNNYYSYPYYYNAYYYPSYSYTTVTDVGISSMPYIKASTPEQLSLQSQNQQLQQQLSQSQADNQKLQGDNQKLQQDLQIARSTIDQQNSSAANMSQQLTYTRYISLALGAIVVILAILSFRFLRQGKGTNTPQQQTTPGKEEYPQSSAQRSDQQPR